MSMHNSKFLCKRHPSHNAIGVCHLCLEKHLLHLIIKRREQEIDGFKHHLRNHNLRKDLKSRQPKQCHHPVARREEVNGEEHGVGFHKGRVHWRGEEVNGEEHGVRFDKGRVHWRRDGYEQGEDEVVVKDKRGKCKQDQSGTMLWSGGGGHGGNCESNNSSSGATSNSSNRSVNAVTTTTEGGTYPHDPIQSMAPPPFPSSSSSSSLMMPSARIRTCNGAIPATIHGLTAAIAAKSVTPHVDGDQELCNGQICQRSESGTPEQDILEAVNGSSSGSYRRLHVDLEQMRQIGGRALKEEKGRGEDQEPSSILSKTELGEGVYRRIHADIHGNGPSILISRKKMALTLNDLLHQEDRDQDPDPDRKRRSSFVALGPNCENIAFHSYYCYYHYSHTPPSR